MTENLELVLYICLLSLGAVVLLIVALALAWLITTRILVYPLRWIFGKVPVFISTRYLFSRKKRNAINIITLISIVGIAVVTCALILVLSIFNGFQLLIEDLFCSFDPDLKVTAARGRTFEYDESVVAQLLTIDGIEKVSPTIENRAVIKYFDKQAIVVIKGFKQDFAFDKQLDTLVEAGSFSLNNGPVYPWCVPGTGVADILSSNLMDQINPLEVFVAIDKEFSMLNPENALKTAYFFPSGYFSVQLEYDQRFVLVDFEVAKELFEMENKVTAYEIKITNINQAATLKPKIIAVLGDKFKVQTWFEQHETLYNVMQNEKLVAYLVLTLILLLAGVNIIGSLSMIVIEKSRDIAILKATGADRGLIRKVFISEGFLVGMIGGLGGAFMALTVGYLELRFGLVGLNGGESFLIDRYPLDLRLSDFILIFGTVFVLSLLSAWIPSQKAAETNISAALRG